MRRGHANVAPPQRHRVQRLIPTLTHRWRSAVSVRWAITVCLLAGVCAVGACANPGSPTGPGTPPPGGGGATDPAPRPGPGPGPGPGGTPTFTGQVPAYQTRSHDYTATAAGTLTVTVTWTVGADLDVYLTGPDCTGYPPDSCAILARSTLETGTTEELTRRVQQNDRFKVWVDNLSRSAGADYQGFAVVR